MSTTYSDALRKAVAESKAPGAAAYIGLGERTLLHEAFGFRQIVPARLPAQTDTLYDLASLTKVVATTTAILLLRDEGALDLDQPVSELLPLREFHLYTPRMLLTHTSGLPSHKTWYKEVTSVDEYIQRIASLSPDSPPGSRRQYSDLGFLILGRIVEMAGRDSLDAFCKRRIFDPLGMTRTGFRPPESLRANCAATENCPWRKRLLVGEVHDENAFAVGGVAGHAGLFGTAGDLALFCRALLAEKILAGKTLDEMTRFDLVPSHPWQGMGWKSDPWQGSSEGFVPSRKAIGHTGWTGTSLWADRDSGYFSILLSNTPHPGRDRRDNGTLRRRFYGKTAWPQFPAQTNAHTGLDRLLWEGFDPMRGKRIALLTHHAAVDMQGRHILDVLAHAPDVRLQRIYSPEHGLSGRAEAGEKVGAQQAAAPVVSLYGQQKRPAPAEMRDIDLFVVDLQDVGARFYTYIATMKECMAACAEAKMPMLILDRPNPIGGMVIEGPMASETGSIVCCAPIPIRHGMTIGETALHFQKLFFGGAKFNVIVNTCDNWPRERMFGSLSLPWTPPSPNIPTWETALLYPGMCLLEGLNLNEGRGTETPFFLCGAPWLDAEGVIGDLAPVEHSGCRLEACEYTPAAIPGKASDPKYKGGRCKGIRIHIETPEYVRAFTLTAAMISAIQRRHPKKLEWLPFFDTLAGGPWLREQIQSGLSGLAIAERIAPQLEAFDRARPRRYTDTRGLLA